MLPIDAHLEKILGILKTSSNLILSASPGAGKTTRLPPELIQLTDKKVFVLEPRRIAAVGAAARIAEERNWQLGNEVGYQIRFDSQCTDETRVVFLTEALLNRKLIHDPELKDVGIVVLDEFHERSIHVDLALGLLKELQELSRPDLKIIVMSATLSAEPISAFLNQAPIYQVPGQSFELAVTQQKLSQKLQTNGDWIEQTKKSIQSVLPNLKSGEHALVFLPGVGEIERLATAMASWCELNSFVICQLHGGLSLQEQKNVLKPSPLRKVILATNVAESSITIDGVRLVVDTGLQRQSNTNPKTGFPALNLTRISKSSARQRAGRAARQAPGQCHQLWNQLDERSMLDFDQPEILRTDLAESILYLAHCGITDFQNFSWFESPDKTSLNRAIGLLKSLNALDQKNEITSLGKKMLRFPLPPRWAKAMVLAQESGLEAETALMAAMMQDRALKVYGDTTAECDLIFRLEFVMQNRSRYSNLFKVANQLTKSALPQNLQVDKIKKLLLEVFLDQISKRRRPKENKGLMISGLGLTLAEDSQVRDSDFFLPVQIMDGKVSIACGVQKSWIEELCSNKIQEKSWVEFDSESGKVLRKSARVLALDSVGSLPLENERIHPASSADAAEFLPEIAFQAREEIFSRNEGLKDWLCRFQFFQKVYSIKELSDEVWKEVFAEACYQETSLKSLFEKNLIPFVETRIPPSTLKSFHTEAPMTIEVPTGNKIKINYLGAAPTLEVRLQEIFGWTATPVILGGKIPLTISLLAPNYRSVQITQDLKSFWQNGYFEVRKELKTRYPKHSWPEDPLTALPVAKGRPRKL
jgi:ATP-dependent helicase HrpB